MWRKEKRKIYIRKIKSFWIDFSHNRIGFFGLALMLFFVFAAIFAPVLAPDDPILQKKVAARYSMPSWMGILPQFQNLPKTFDVPFNLTASQQYDTISVSHSDPDTWFEINYTSNGNLTEQIYIFQREFNYTYEEPRDWTLRTAWLGDFSDLDYRYEVYFRSANGTEYIIYGIDYDIVTKRVGVTEQMWNVRSAQHATGAGSTYLLRRLHYEKFYQERFDHYMSFYSTGNYTITPELMAFTYEGFQNKTLIENATINPVFSLYQILVEGEETNATWAEYWDTWNRTEGAILWNVTSQYMGSVWIEFIESRNVTDFTSPAYFVWFLGNPPAQNYTFRERLSWEEFIQIWNLTFTTMKDDWNDYVDAMNKTDVTSPAYERWVNFNATGQINATWTEYLNMWIEIQRQASTSFINKEVKPLQAAESLADTRAKFEAHNLAATSPLPTYYLGNKGTQALVMKLYVYPKFGNATLSLRFTRDRSFFTVWGSVHGILGTNSFGFDVWTQLVHGARISLVVGSLAAVLSTSLGILFGVVAGYVSGIVDEAIMRVVDVLLCLPILPLLLALSAYWRPNVYYIIVLIAIFGWQGLSRLIRSRVLSIREMPFIESARASGASTSYLIFRHLIPNVFPIAMASLILAVPGAILTEAALSFLGFGDPFAPTWGKMLYEAQSEGAFGRLAWWYIIPPGLAITLLCVSFVFIGHALDEVVNPRLRRRR